MACHGLHLLLLVVVNLDDLGEQFGFLGQAKCAHGVLCRADLRSVQVLVELRLSDVRVAEAFNDDRVLAGSVRVHPERVLQALHVVRGKLGLVLVDCLEEGASLLEAAYEARLPRDLRLLHAVQMNQHGLALALLYALVCE